MEEAALADEGMSTAGRREIIMSGNSRPSILFPNEYERKYGIRSTSSTRIVKASFALAIPVFSIASLSEYTTLEAPREPALEYLVH